MLLQDHEVFNRRFKSAAKFFRAATLREECLQVARIFKRTKYQEQRLCELFKTPACREPWFQDLLCGYGWTLEDLRKYGM